VLVAYEYRCAMCGWDGRLDSTTVGLDAAHVRWWAMGGPDVTSNGLCLCTMHHKLLDVGVLGLTSDLRLAVSQHFVGRGQTAEDFVTSLIGSELRKPQGGESPVAAAHIEWHTDQVFQSPARLTS
jgi:putative restriction endonuclease